MQTLALFPGRSASPWWWFGRTGLHRCHTPSPDTASCWSRTPRKVALYWGGTASPCSWSLRKSAAGFSCPGAACPWFWLPLSLRQKRRGGSDVSHRFREGRTWWKVRIRAEAYLKRFKHTRNQEDGCHCYMHMRRLKDYIFGILFNWKFDAALF